MIIPPFPVHSSHHDFEDNHVVPRGFSFIFPQTLRWRTQMGSDASKSLHKRITLGVVGRAS